MKNRDNHIFEELKQQGFRLTDVRRKLILYILNREGHWTIQQLAFDAPKFVKGVGVATVYRTVSLLLKLGKLSETRIGTEASRYEVQPEHHHDHLTCLDCDKIFEFENKEIESLQVRVAKNLGFKLKDHRMELFANCIQNNCKNKR